MRSSTLVLASAVASIANAVYFKYSTDQTGLFIQEDPSINSSPPDYAKVNLGLVTRSYTTDAAFDPTGQKTQWERFANYVKDLNANSGPSAQYKVLYLVRHGEAYHNLAQSAYPADCWDCYWSQQDGNGTLTWSDAALTPKGQQQDLAANKFWKDSVTTSKIPLPATVYTSPLDRCLESVNLMFASLPTSAAKTFAPVVKEGLRENVSACTCNRRHSKTWIQQTFPGYAIETGFAEVDSLWVAGQVESTSAQLTRRQKALDDIFSSDANTFVSLTTHSGVVSSLLSIIGYPNKAFGLPTGQTMAILVKAEKVDGAAPAVPVTAPTSAKTCTKC